MLSKQTYKRLWKRSGVNPEITRFFSEGGKCLLAPKVSKRYSSAMVFYFTAVILKQLLSP